MKKISYLEFFKKYVLLWLFSILFLILFSDLFNSVMPEMLESIQKTLTDTPRFIASYGLIFLSALISVLITYYFAVHRQVAEFMQAFSLLELAGTSRRTLIRWILTFFLSIGLVVTAVGLLLNWLYSDPELGVYFLTFWYFLPSLVTISAAILFLVRILVSHKNVESMR